MVEITKFRRRLENMSRSSNEFRMTAAEARGLLAEIDLVIKNGQTAAASRPASAPPAPRTGPSVYDGGSF